MDVDTWFAERGLRLDVHEVDVTGMERIRPGIEDEPPRFHLTLIGLGGHLHRAGYASGNNLAEAKAEARQRYLHEQSIPPPAALRWSTPVLTTVAADGSWEPAVELINLTDSAITVSGPLMAEALLLRPDGSQVASRQQQPWPMPAVLKRHHLEPRGFTLIPIALSLMRDEKAALPPGRYRLTEVWWGELTAPDVDVEFRAS